MRIPRKVKIGAYTYKVIRQDKVMHDDEEQDGLCDNINMKIYVRKGLDTTRKKIVFFHECFHAICHVSNVTLSEEKVDILDDVFIQFFQENKLSFM